MIHLSLVLDFSLSSLYQRMQCDTHNRDEVIALFEREASGLV